MIVKNIKNRQRDIPVEYQQYAFGQNSNDILPLTIGKKYVVSAVKNVAGTDFYLVLSDDRELKASPWWYPESLFSIEDPAEPADWIKDETDPSFKIKGFKEIVDDPKGTFYNDLEDGEDAAIAVFLKHYNKYVQK